MAFVSLPATDVDAKSPLDDDLFSKIKENFDDLNSRVVLAGASPFVFEVMGKLSYITDHRRSLAFGLVHEEFTPSRCRYMLKKSGSTGLTFDIRKHTAPRVPITSILPQYSATIQSITQVGTTTTQSVARAASQISTQSITHAKAAHNIQSIISLGTIVGLGSDMWQINLDAPIDSDTLVGDSITFASATSGGNNGTFVVQDKNRGGGNNVVVTNASGVAQTGAAGTAQVKIMSYNFTNPVDTFFESGLLHTFGSHSTGANNGNLLVYAINQGGNNIWVKNSSGATQVGVAGTVDTALWKFSFSSPASTTDFNVGERAMTASHSSGGNNSGALSIRAINSGGNNVVLYNVNGVAQGGSGGTVRPNRWIYAMPTDPSSHVTAGHSVDFTGASNSANNGNFVVAEVNRAASNNIVVKNEDGVAQGGSGGTVKTTRKIVSFSSDQSANFTTASYIEMNECVSAVYNYAYNIAPYRVLEVNRGGGANYNVVIECQDGPDQVSPAGKVEVEMKSIFNTAPTLAASTESVEPNLNVAGTSTDFLGTAIAAQTPLMLYITSYPSGDPRDLTVLLR